MDVPLIVATDILMASIPYVSDLSAKLLSLSTPTYAKCKACECRGCLITVVFHLLNLFLKPV